MCEVELESRGSCQARSGAERFGSCFTTIHRMNTRR